MSRKKKDNTHYSGCMYLPRLPRNGCDTSSIFGGIYPAGIHRFHLRVIAIKVKGPSFPFYLPIAGERIVLFIPFRRLLELYEIQTAWSKI